MCIFIQNWYYKPTTYLKVIAKHHNRQIIIPEILKYQVKELDLIANREWFLELTEQLHKTRAVAVGGVLRHYMSELQKEPENLIGEDNQNEVDEGHLYFQWKRKQKTYKLAQLFSVNTTCSKAWKLRRLNQVTSKDGLKGLILSSLI